MRRRAYLLLQRLLLRALQRVEPVAVRRIVAGGSAKRDCKAEMANIFRALYRETGRSTLRHSLRLQLLLTWVSEEDCNDLRQWLLAHIGDDPSVRSSIAVSRDLEFVPAASARAIIQTFEILSAREPDFATNDEICNVAICTSGLASLSCGDSGLEPATEYALRFALQLTEGLRTTMPDLHVVVFGYSGELSVANGVASGKFAYRGSTYCVADAVSPAFADHENRYLYIRFSTPVAPGVYRVRCSVYANTTLLQSRIVSVGVSNDVAMTMHIDYRLTGTIGSSVGALEAPHLSLMLNSDPLATHTLRLFSERPQLVGSATFDHHEISDFIHDARAALRHAAWGDADAWAPGKPYLYATKDSHRLRRDLRTLAIRGRRFYVELGVRFAGGAQQLRTLEPSLRRPGGIELALRDGARLLLPISCVYDLPLDTALRSHDFCDIFLSALDENMPLADTVCFRTGCRYTGHTNVICPSGFWGFRHWIAVPASQPKNTAWPDIAPTDVPEIVVGTATSLRTAQEHIQSLRQSAGRAAFTSIATREELLRTLRNVSPHLLYLFCHAGIDHNIPYFHVGSPSEASITGDTLYTAQLDWPRTRPLVFLNGCETAAVSADVALSLVSHFLHYASASGVIGTEITAFESLAAQFAEVFFPHFLAGVPVVKAVRLARLALLQDGNPLGLIYVPFVPSVVSLKRPHVLSNAA